MHKYLVQVSAIDRCVWKSLRLCHLIREAGGPGLRCSLRPERCSKRPRLVQTQCWCPMNDRHQVRGMVCGFTISSSSSSSDGTSACCRSELSTLPGWSEAQECNAARCDRCAWWRLGDGPGPPCASKGASSQDGVWPCCSAAELKHVGLGWLLDERHASAHGGHADGPCAGEIHPMCGRWATRTHTGFESTPGSKGCGRSSYDNPD